MPDSNENGLTFGAGDWFWRADGTHSTEAPATPAANTPQSLPQPVRDPAGNWSESGHSLQPSHHPSTDPRWQAQTRGEVTKATDWTHLHRNNGEVYFSGVAISEEDAPIFASFANVLAANGVDPVVGGSIVRWYDSFAKQQDATQAAADELQRKTNAASLQREWGGNFTKNVEECFRLIDQLADEETADFVFNARTPDGGLLGNHPGFMRWLHSLASGRNSPNRQIAAGYGGGSVPTAADEAELASIRKLMGNSRSAYWYGRDAERLQARYRELIQRRNGG